MTFLNSHLAAQPSIQPGQDFEAQVERFRQEYLFEKQIRMEKKKQKPSIQFEEPEKTSLPEGIDFQLNDIHLVGSTTVEPEYFRSIWEPYVGKQVNFKDLEKIINEIKTVYKQLGYPNVNPYLPPQDIKDGIVEIRVIEGKMGDLKIEGNRWFSSASIKEYFHPVGNEVLNIKEIERDIKRLNENPDLDVNAILSPGQQPETIDVTLKATESFPWHFKIGADNQGTRLAGKYRRSFIMNNSNLTGHHDLLYLNTIFSDHSSGEYLAYRLPFGTDGVTLGVDLGYFESKMGEEIEQFDITGNTKIYNPNVSWELYQREDSQLDARAGIRIKDIKKKIARDKSTDDQLRLPYLGLDFVKSDKAGQTIFSPEVSFGTEGFLGASSQDNPVASRSGTTSFFTKYEHSLSRYHVMPWDSHLEIRSRFQAASDTLPTSEQFQLGGASSVRGYPEGDYLADIGGDLNLDWLFPLYFIPADWRLGSSAENLQHQIEPLIFVDIGGGKLIKVLPGEQESKFLVGVGGGLKIHVHKNLYLRLEWSNHIGDEPISGTGPSTFHFSFQMGT